MFQFPLHRDPRCNAFQDRQEVLSRKVSVPFTSGSSLQPIRNTPSTENLASFSSLYIGILAATLAFPALLGLILSFSSLYIGILAATNPRRRRA